MFKIIRSIAYQLDKFSRSLPTYANARFISATTHILVVHSRCAPDGGWSSFIELFPIPPSRFGSRMEEPHALQASHPTQLPDHDVGLGGPTLVRDPATPSAQEVRLALVDVSRDSLHGLNASILLVHLVICHGDQTSAVPVIKEGLSSVPNAFGGLLLGGAFDGCIRGAYHDEDPSVGPGGFVINVEAPGTKLKLGSLCSTAAHVTLSHWTE
ncbi:hypothetical protein BV22DRAFT_462607 [Leucogyrophana mollusca]|uniref:Uncharacterized protein n=1 Tax=Leucogyrophana mollusca TaxID=85980 RepID=A0ACB8BGT0_9AGAM|nr:hypothetical protein BV22DRAFT_462607 [Leucogyrophana mollusca]